MAGPVTAFLEGEGVDARGRSIFDVLGMDNVALERTHDFIQWLFPLPEPSAAVPPLMIAGPTLVVLGMAVFAVIVFRATGPVKANA